MKRAIVNYLAKFITKDAPRPLGRWSTEHCAIKLDKKIDMSNEDHCGPCGEYAKTTADSQAKRWSEKVIR